MLTSRPVRDEPSLNKKKIKVDPTDGNVSW